MISSSEVKEKLYSSLGELGLTESETNLYITSLSLGPSAISLIAKQLGIPRPNVYKLIAGLEKSGLAKFSERKRYAHTFIVEPPTVVLEKLRQKRETVADLDHTLVGMMPDLLAHYHQGETLTKIRIFNGKEQWLEVFFKVLEESNKNISFFGSADAFIQLISWQEENRWIKKRVAKSIHIDCLLVPGDDATTLQESDTEEMRTTRFFNGKMPFITGFMLYANKIIIWQPKAPLVLLIEDEYIVQMLQSIFNEMWQTADQPKSAD